MKNTYKFLLWSNCNFDCDFCWQRRSVGKDTIVFDYQRSVPCLQIEKFLDSAEFVIGSNLHLSGGELFAHRLDPEFENLITLIASKMLSNKIDILYLSSNLTYEPLDYLVVVLEVLKSNNLLHRVKIITSYDIAGRFLNKELENLMFTNLQTIRTTYPEIEISTNIILTKQMCDVILNNQFSIKEFMNTYGVIVNLLPYEILLSEYTPSEKKLHNTLIVVEKENPGYLNKLYNQLLIDSQQTTYEFRSGNMNIFNKLEIELLPCGHASKFNKCYEKNNKCFLCELDKLRIK